MVLSVIDLTRKAPFKAPAKIQDDVIDLTGLSDTENEEATANGSTEASNGVLGRPIIVDDEPKKDDAQKYEALEVKGNGKNRAGSAMLFANAISSVKLQPDKKSNNEVRCSQSHLLSLFESHDS